MLDAKNQKSEIQTIAERSITLKLSDADVTRLWQKAGCAGMTPDELLSSFIGDLVCGTYSNGSDERMFAQDWFARCGFEHMDRSFIHYLIAFDEFDEFCDSLDTFHELIEDLDQLNPDDQAIVEDYRSEFRGEIDSVWRNYSQWAASSPFSFTPSFSDAVYSVEQWRARHDSMLSQRTEQESSPPQPQNQSHDIERSKEHRYAESR